MDGRYKEFLQTACVQIVSAVIAQHQFSETGAAIASPVVLAASKELRAALIRGAAGEYWAFTLSGAAKDWHTFCNAFIAADHSDCVRAFDGT